MSKSIKIAQTYSTADDTSVGWRITWHGGRLMAERRSRWQGSRDGCRLLIDRLPLQDARDWVAAARDGYDGDVGLDIELDARLEDQDGVTDPGYIVR